MVVPVVDPVPEHSRGAKGRQRRRRAAAPGPLGPHPRSPGPRRRRQGLSSRVHPAQTPRVRGPHRARSGGGLGGDRPAPRPTSPASPGVRGRVALTRPQSGASLSAPHSVFFKKVTTSGVRKLPNGGSSPRASRLHAAAADVHVLLRFHGDACDATQGSQEPAGPGTVEAGLPPAPPPTPPSGPGCPPHDALFQKCPGRRWVEPPSLVPTS